MPFFNSVVPPLYFLRISVFFDFCLVLRAFRYTLTRYSPAAESALEGLFYSNQFLPTSFLNVKSQRELPNPCGLELEGGALD